MRSRGRGRVVPPSQKKYIVTLELTESERSELMALAHQSTAIARLCNVGGLKENLHSLNRILDNIPEESFRRLTNAQTVV